VSPRRASGLADRGDGAREHGALKPGVGGLEEVARRLEVAAPEVAPELERRARLRVEELARFLDAGSRSLLLLADVLPERLVLHRERLVAVAGRDDPAALDRRGA